MVRSLTPGRYSMASPRDVPWPLLVTFSGPTVWRSLLSRFMSFPGLTYIVGRSPASVYGVLWLRFIAPKGFLYGIPQGLRARLSAARRVASSGLTAWQPPDSSGPGGDD